MSKLRQARAEQRRRYLAIMKSWRQLRRSDPEQRAQRRATRRRLLEELRALDRESADESGTWR
ncbi:hypothetical protein LK07_20555 [Streptomyces pluripotens]|uniref:Uncharacterized protein n=1 Tax=Streptomyces pluripotens TaxID=1355015 RepID=A0A221P191_9ACTN|nr:hypothetical protein [Streptomyces pluripotens]ARP71748.1 hypothetical protein LK06_019390 [Streptomyces pluripotens]ASN26001.1 hypothetical protein LK07_20555 [Streptomyces pluripotens]